MVTNFSNQVVGKAPWGGKRGYFAPFPNNRKYKLAPCSTKLFSAYMAVFSSISS